MTTLHVVYQYTGTVFSQLMFKTANHKTSCGLEAVYQRYKESYPEMESIGGLKFSIKDVTLVNSITANLHGY